ncbi:MAG: efflux RND transporter periplasmic adaptor subunit [Proteobacteria bacterium]|nr:efflux RND transporter periplasmic adaptor subunit [Pseudomonadota bacterium]
MSQNEELNKPSHKSWRPYFFQGMLALMLVAGGLYAGWYFYQDPETAQRQPRTDRGILVEVEAFTNQSHPIVLSSTGQVVASRSQTIRSEVSGRVTWVSEHFYPGARLKRGDIIARISQEDYAIRVSNAKIALRQREVALVLEEARGKAAKAELEMLKQTMNGVALSDDEMALVRRGPQLQDAIAGVELARNSLKQAQLDLDRSVIRCPYDVFVETVTVSTGDYIGGNTTIGTVTAMDVFWVEVSILPALAGWIGASPDKFAQSKAEVSYDIGGSRVTRPARILSLLGRVEPLGRMVQIVLAVDDPFGPPVDSPLLLGTFVHVQLTSPQKIEAIRLPRAYVREGNQVYVSDAENRLRIRTLTTPFRTDDYVYVTGGLSDGERVITTLISSPVDGRLVRIRGEEAPRGGGGGPPDGAGRGRGGAPDGAGGRGGAPDGEGRGRGGASGETSGRGGPSERGGGRGGGRN